MLRLKIIGLTVMAVLALSAIAAGSASAACTTKAKSGLIRLCVENTPSHTGTVGVTTRLTSATANLGLKLESGLLKNSTLVCKKMATTTSFLNPEKSAVELNSSTGLMSECHLEGEAEDANLNKKCVVITNWESQIDGTFGASAELLTMAPFEKGGIIGAVKWSNNGTEHCVFVGKENTYRGSWQCKLHEPEVEAVEHELACETTKGILFGEEEGTSLKYTQSISLGSEKFKVYEASSSSE